MHERRRTLIPGGVNSNVRLRGFPTPLTFRSGRGARIWDVDDNEYVDYAMGMGPHILGHAPPVVVDAVRRSLDRGQLFAGQCEEEAELAELLHDVVPWVESVRFGSSGTEMALLAIRIARAVTGRQRVVRFVGHYHGWLDPLFVDPSVVGRPDAPPLTNGQSSAASSDLLMCPWNDATALDAIMQMHGSDIAAVLMEPIMCNTGVIPPSPGYLETVKAMCAARGIVFVVDEVITGFRVALDGAQGQLGVHGDLTVYAKAIASGFPVAALAGRSDLLEQVGTGGINHSGTYNTGVSQMAAAVATLRHLRDADVHPTIAAAGAELVAGIRTLATRLAPGLTVHAVDGMFQLRFGPDEPIGDAATFAAASDPERLGQLLTALQAEGVRSTSRGLFFLSAAHDGDDIAATLGAFERALASQGATA
jgi:glutamate-1-semialdehyde 2,1-aminomutase